MPPSPARLLVLVGLVAAAPAARAQLAVTVQTDRATYAVGEAIRASVTAVNPGPGSVSLVFHSGQRAGVQIGGVPGSSCLCAYVLEGATETFMPGVPRTWGTGSEAALPGGRSCLDYDPTAPSGLCPALPAGTYTVRGYVGDGLGLYGEGTTTITVTGVTSAEDGPVGARPSVAPNPARGEAAVTFAAPAEGPVRVVDARGRTVRTVDGAGRTRVGLSVAGLPAGVYAVRTAGQPAARLVVAP